MCKTFRSILMAVALLFALTACGERVEVPPGTAGKIMTKDGYQEGMIPPSKFRLAPCWAYCDRLVLVDTSDKAKQEELAIFMPQDKLNVNLGIRVTLGLTNSEIEGLFNSLVPKAGNDSISFIEWEQVYTTYAQQIVLAETREYISKYTIAEVASSLEKVNADLSAGLQKRIEERTPFSVRYVGITNIAYPKIITEAQENAAERREKIQQEEAQLQISKVTLERELQETRLKRQIELEKAQIEAKSQEIQKEVVDEKVLKLRALQNEAAWIEKWDGKVPATMIGGEGESNLLLSLPNR